ncbi:MAG TPA: 2-polyprenylphenol 6-hydroxylase [Coxiellaceae bacterium]|nr:2-polyprenylphenol 6-hydroxylase [Coxiellaceae bacterium]
MKCSFLLFKALCRPDVLPLHFKKLRALSYLNPARYSQTSTRAQALRISLEKLGPVFIKFGQVLSTRPDLFPEDIIEEFSKLQDRVPPFSSVIVKQCLEKTYKKPLAEVFQSFGEVPLASASIAQVHTATLFSGERVVIKIVRPGLEKMIRKNIRFLYRLAKFTHRWGKSLRRLRPLELVEEFERVIMDELDMLREAASASTLRRNFDNTSLLYVPKVFWDYTDVNVLVMERIYGLPISRVETLKQQHVNLKKLAENGVEIFFTQVFRDRFFHADMHPGNLFVDVRDPENPMYVGVDFGIMGTLTPHDTHYLAENLLAFFHRDYLRVAELHIESGWVPKHTPVNQFEAAIRTVAEPIFERPLKEISFAKLLIRLFQTAERFDMHVQPQLLLLQKTLLNVEGLGRRLYPELDLWTTAKPFLEKFIRQEKKLDSPVALFLNRLPELIKNFLEALQKIPLEINKEQ